MKINDVVFLPVTVLETYGGGVEADVEYVIGDDVIPIFGVPAEDLGEARALLIRALTAQAWAVAMKIEAWDYGTTHAADDDLEQIYFEDGLNTVIRSVATLPTPEQMADEILGGR